MSNKFRFAENAALKSKCKEMFKLTMVFCLALQLILVSSVDGLAKTRTSSKLKARKAVAASTNAITTDSTSTIDDKKDKEKQKKKLREYKKDVKEIIELKDYGFKKYNGKDEDDIDFKNDVDRDFAQLRRKHQVEAFRTNTAPPLRVMGDLEGEGGNRSAQAKGAEAAAGGALYDNPTLQDYISRVGHNLVPIDSKNLYAFRILQDPLPRAEALSTGTVYVSTGLLGMLDNEAQLAYILAHEIAHLEKNHWFTKALLPLALEEKNKDKAKKRARIGLIAGLAGGALGAKLGGAEGALLGGLGGLAGGGLLGGLLVRNLDITEWDTADEDEADKMAFDLCLKSTYDVRETPKLLAIIKNAVTSDKRIGLGFMGSPSHVDERVESVNFLLDINDSLIKTLSAQNSLIGSQSDFEVLMAEVKRDNAVLAFYYDMFSMTRKDLEWSLRVRSDDAKSHYYLGKVLKLTAKSKEEKERAMREIATALTLDRERGAYPGIRLQYALHLMDQKDVSKNPEAAKFIKEYVRLYKLNNYGGVPPNIDILYDYLTQVGDKTWFSPPTSNISTQDVSPVYVQATIDSTSKPLPIVFDLSNKPLAVMIDSTSNPLPVKINDTISVKNTDPLSVIINTPVAPEPVVDPNAPAPAPNTVPAPAPEATNTKSKPAPTGKKN